MEGERKKKLRILQCRNPRLFVKITYYLRIIYVIDDINLTEKIIEILTRQPPKNIEMLNAMWCTLKRVLTRMCSVDPPARQHKVRSSPVRSLLTPRGKLTPDQWRRAAAAARPTRKAKSQISLTGRGRWRGMFHGRAVEMLLSTLVVLGSPTNKVLRLVSHLKSMRHAEVPYTGILSLVV